MGMFDGIGSALLGQVQQAKNKAKGLMFKQNDVSTMPVPQQAAGPTQPGAFVPTDYSGSGSSVQGLQKSAAKLGYIQGNEANKELMRLQPQQTEFANQLAAGALGQGPSLAEAQMKATNERTLAQQLAAAKSARNVNPALAQRNIGNIAAQQNMALAQNTAMAKMQEQQQKQQMFNQYLQQQNQQVLQGAGAGSQAAAQAGATQQAGQNSQNAMIGSLLGAGASILAGPAGSLAGNLFSQAAGPSAGLAAQASQMPTLQQPTSMLNGNVPQPQYHLSKGGMVPGPEYFKGDSIKNDVVDAKLSAGEIVIPKSIAQGSKKDIMSFIEKIAQNKQKAPTEPKNKKGFESVVRASKGGK